MAARVPFGGGGGRDSASSGPIGAQLLSIAEGGGEGPSVHGHSTLSEGRPGS